MEEALKELVKEPEVRDVLAKNAGFMVSQARMTAFGLLSIKVKELVDEYNKLGREAPLPGLIEGLEKHYNALMEIVEEEISGRKKADRATKENETGSVPAGE